MLKNLLIQVWRLEQDKQNEPYQLSVVSLCLIQEDY